MDATEVQAARPRPRHAWGPRSCDEQRTWWDGQYGNTYLALVGASDRMPVMRHYFTLIVQMGGNRYSRWYVLDGSGKYLSNGFDSQVAATAAAGSIARVMSASQS